MCLTFNGLKGKPFNLTSDPKFFYLTLGHRQALAQLLSGVQERKGFISPDRRDGEGEDHVAPALLQQLDGKSELLQMT